MIEAIISTTLTYILTSTIVLAATLGIGVVGVIGAALRLFGPLGGVFARYAGIAFLMIFAGLAGHRMADDKAANANALKTKDNEIARLNTALGNQAYSAKVEADKRAEAEERNKTLAGKVADYEAELEKRALPVKPGVCPVCVLTDPDIRGLNRLRYNRR